jgi:hypothetical protein
MIITAFTNYVRDAFEGESDEEFNAEETINTLAEELKKILNNINVTKMETKESKKMDLVQLKTEHPDAYTTLQILAENEAAKKLQSDIDAVKKELQEAKDEAENVKKELQEAKVKIDDYETKEAIIVKEAFIVNSLKEAKIEDKVSETFLAILKEEVSNEKITKLIADKVETINGMKKETKVNIPVTKNIEENKKSYKDLLLS